MQANVQHRKSATTTRKQENVSLTNNLFLLLNCHNAFLNSFKQKCKLSEITLILKHRLHPVMLNFASLAGLSVISNLSSKNLSNELFSTPLLKPAIWCVSHSLSLNSLLPFVTSVINASLSSGLFPPSFKIAVVKPLLKKPSLDSNDLKNYRPVSNMPVLSKITDRIILSQLNDYLASKQPLEPSPVCIPVSPQPRNRPP